MKILVTGTAGFIGFHLANQLIREGHEVTGLDSINDYYDTGLKYGRLQQTGIDQKNIQYGKLVKSNAYPNYQFVQLQLEDKEGILQLFAQQQFDYVCNLAAQAGVRYSLINPYAYIQSNINGFINLLEACRHHAVKHLVYASTSSVYGLNTHMPLSPHESTEHPMTLYAATKKANEMMAHSYSHLFNIPTTGLRFFTVYGPWGRPDMALFLFTQAILENKPIDVFNYGEMIRDFTYVTDIAAGVAKVIMQPASCNEQWNSEHPDPASSSAPYRIYNIGNANPVKLTDYIEALEEVLGKKAIKNLLPIQPGDVPATHASMNDLERDFNYCPATPVRDGVKSFVNWYRNYYKV